jgi:nucleotide-binding universal stress UspA family protein
MGRPRYLYLTVGGEYVSEQFDAQAAERDKQLDALLAPWREKHPAVSVSPQMFASPPSRALVESSRLADLIVLGGRARAEGHEGLRVGALAHTVLHHAHCPVVIVPERRQGAREGNPPPHLHGIEASRGSRGV